MTDVLLIEDEASVRLATEQALSLAGMAVAVFANAEDALPAIGADFAGVVLTDVRLPGMSGMALLDEAARRDRDLPVILVTGHGDVELAVQAMRRGAYDFVEKPFGAERLVDVVRRALDRRRLVLENRALRLAASERDALPRLIGDSAAMQRLRGFIATIGPTGADVLINGETGTGKEVVARQLHAAGSPGAPFVAINCAAMPETMFESEVFGHEAGAFTSAQKRRIGKFEFARGGTVFLDEIESMPLALQAKLLRVLQERTVERLGGNEQVRVDCRVVAASKADLLKLSEDGRFRADLYWRIATVSVTLPPLREHPSDVPLLLAHFVAQACARFGRPLPDWSSGQMSEWSARRWSGNVRELKGFAERLVLGVEGEPAAVPADGAAQTLPRQLEAFERNVLRAALARAGGNVALAAEQLGIAKTTLYDKLKRLQVATE
ncbi:MAG: sigma-54-dependent transcriptional regulator [Burkholderiaceae bacterium]|jgi:two-component system C4-dicarboxylate transport response regulator DctD